MGRSSKVIKRPWVFAHGLLLLLGGKMKNFKRFKFILSFLLIFVLGMPINALASEDEFVVGMEVNYAPFNFSQTNDENGAVAVRNSDGEYANGYDVAMAQKIADSLGKKLVIVKTEWDGLAPALTSGKIDAIIAGMSPTPEREKEIDFSDNYYASDLVIVVKKGSKYENAKSIDDFKNSKITGQLNTFHYSVIDQIPSVKKQTAMESFPSMISAVKVGKIDGYVSEKPGAMSAQTSNPDLTYVEFDENKGFKTDPKDTSIAVGLKKGSDLKDKINEILKNIPQKERDEIMQKMVSIGEGDSNISFLGQMKDILAKYGSLFVSGTVNTMAIAIFSTIAGFIIGLFVTMIRKIPVDKKRNPFTFFIHKIINFILVAYIEVFRGTPMMVQSMLIFYGSKQFLNINMDSMPAALFIVSINTGAYLSEVIRGGINSIDNGQFEACKAIGLSHTQTYLSVILPQTIRTILPSIGNEFVVNIKDSSVLNVISVTELFFISKSIAGSTYQIFQTYLVTAIIYFVLTFIVTRLLLLLENRLNVGDFKLESEDLK